MFYLLFHKTYFVKVSSCACQQAGTAESKSLKQYETTAHTDTEIRKIQLDFTIIWNLGGGYFSVQWFELTALTA